MIYMQKVHTLCTLLKIAFTEGKLKYGQVSDREIYRKCSKERKTNTDRFRCNRFKHMYPSLT